MSCNSPTPLPVPVPVYEDSTKTAEKDSFKVQAKVVSLSVYDWDIEDGDAFGISLNGDILADSLPIKKQPYTWYIKNLKEGNNELIVSAKNMGSRGVATPTFELNDGNEVQVFKTNCSSTQPKIILIQLHKN